MKLVGDEDVLLLNNDVVVSKYWLERLHALLYSDSAIGIVGPLTNHSGTVEQVRKCERENTTPKEVKHLSGFCYLIKNEVFKKVGLFNEKYFLAAEDYDYNCRVRKAGYKIMLARDVFVHHHGHVTANNLPDGEADKQWRKSRDMFLNDWPEEK
jgi:GT2 family glycosyltransferase